MNNTTIIKASCEINAEKEKVWKVLKSIGEIEKFHPLVQESRTTTTNRNGIGAKRHCKLLPMGEMEEQVIEWREGESFVMKVVGGKMLPPYEFMKGKVDLKQVNGRTKVSFSFSYRLKYGALGNLMNLLLIKPQFKKGPPKYVEGLKQYVEKMTG